MQVFDMQVTKEGVVSVLTDFVLKLLECHVGTHFSAFAMPVPESVEEDIDV